MTFTKLRNLADKEQDKILKKMTLKECERTIKKHYEMF